ncbi:unnamed protein product [Agarophyton chilense]
MNHVHLQNSGVFSPITSCAQETLVPESPDRTNMQQQQQQRQSCEMKHKEPSAVANTSRPARRTTRNPLSIVMGGIQRDPPLYVRRGAPGAPNDEEKEKEAAITALELSIMGSALVLTLSLQVEEVVGSRGGFGNSTRDTEVGFLFVGASALSFALGFYSIVTAAVMLLSIVATPNMNAQAMLKKMSWWLMAPRLCTLAAAGCLGVKALIAHFLGLERSASILGAVVIGIGMLLTGVATATICQSLVDFSARHVDDEGDSDNPDVVSQSSKDGGKESCTAGALKGGQTVHNVMGGEDVLGNGHQASSCRTYHVRHCREERRTTHRSLP